jgi:hypothetical protein
MSAATASEIDGPANMKIKREGNLFLLDPGFTVFVKFNGRDSWVLKGQKTPDLLKHEQGHLDITGLVAYEKDRLLKALRSNDAQDLIAQVKQIHNRNHAKLDGLQKKYEGETQNGRNVQNQAAWNQLIANCIKNNYAPLPNPFLKGGGPATKSAAPEKTASFKPSKPPAEEKKAKKTFVHIALLDAEGKPVAKEPYKVTLPDGRIVSGELDQNGTARIDNVDPGKCKIRFPELDKVS